MADLQELLGDPDEIKTFCREEDLRPFWPNQPTRCPVIRCSEQLYSSHGTFYRHWQQTHLPNKMGYTCPCCEHKFYRRDYALRHVRTKHALLDKDKLLEKEEPNEHYVNPDSVLPYRINYKERHALKRRRQSTLETALITTAADCRDEVILFDDHGNTLGKTYKRSYNK
jgi:hypothetical protein